MNYFTVRINIVILLTILNFFILVLLDKECHVTMESSGQKQFKSKCHILVWITLLALALIGMVEYGYFLQNRPPFKWQIYLGLFPYAAWIVLTYLATKPKWFTARYNVGEMYKVHRIVGVVATALVGVHWYVYFGKALKSPLGWWGGYTSLIAMFIAFAVGIFFLTPWFKSLATAMPRKAAVWIHRLNLVALVAVDIHVHGFKRLAAMVPFMPVFDILTYGLVIYYIYWMLKKRN